MIGDEHFHAGVALVTVRAVDRPRDMATELRSIVWTVAPKPGLPSHEAEWAVGHPPDCPVEVVLTTSGHGTGMTATVEGPDGTRTSWRAVAKPAEVTWGGRTWRNYWQREGRP